MVPHKPEEPPGQAVALKTVGGFPTRHPDLDRDLDDFIVRF